MSVFRKELLSVGIVGLLAAVSGTVSAAPQAGSVIGNQASATYTDTSGREFSTTSNLVETIVQPIYGVSLQADRDTLSSAGSPVYFTHVLSNNGNAEDSFSLAASNAGGDDFDLSNLGVYLDLNRDGNPDSSEAVTEVSLQYGDEVNIIVAGNVPGLAAAGDAASITVTATSTSDGAQLSTVTDTVTLRSGAVVQVTKAMSATSGISDSDSGSATPYTVTLSYHNTGNATAANLELTDPLPAGMHYVDDSGRASVVGASTLTDDASAEPATSNGSTVTFRYDSGLHQVRYTIDSVAAGASGTLQFQVYILDTDVDGNPLLAGNITNTASYAYDAQPQESTNSVQFTVEDEIAIALNSPGLDTQTIAAADQGAVVTFTQTLDYSGNVDETFNLTLSGDSYPAGTVFKLFRADGVTPLVDTNGDGVIDSGVMEAGESLDVVLKVYLSPGAEAAGVGVTLSAVSVTDSSVSDGVINALTSIDTLAVDLTANASVGGGGDGAGQPGAGGEASPVDTETANPGDTLLIPLFINNLSSAADNYGLNVDSLPAGWSVEFILDSNADGSVSSGETTVVNSGAVNGSATVAILARVIVPADATPVNADLVFHIQSPNSSAEDYLKFRVAVSDVYGLEVEQSHSGQAAAGTSIVFPHRISNPGNLTTTDVTLSLAHSNSQGWTASLYLDDGTTVGALDSSDSVFDPASPINLSAGAEATVFVRVIVPLSATAGAQDTITLTASMVTPQGTFTDSTADTVSVIATEMNLLKEQALDADCNGSADSGFSNGNISSGAVPGACVLYRITATNSGSEAVSELVIYDSTPQFTTLETSALAPVVTVGGVSSTGAGDCSTETRGVTAPADEAAGTIAGYICGLAAGASSTLDFGVQINP